MDVCAAFAFLALGFALLVVIGHGIWMLCAMIFRTMGEPPRDDQPSPRRTCVRCDTTFDRRAPECPSCGLDPLGPVATELRELEITTRQIQALVQKQVLEAPIGEQIYRLLEERQTELIRRKRPVPATEPAIIPWAQSTLLPGEATWHLLERLLAGCENVLNLSASRREQALVWFRQLDDEELAQLSPGCLLNLIRLLRSVRWVARCLGVARLLLWTHPYSLEALEAAGEAGRFAAAEHLSGHARWFLNWAMDHTRNEAERREVHALLESLPPGDDQELPELKESGEQLPVGSASPVVLEAAPSRRPLGELLAGFMEERNILWGELVGGLLIVGCSIALVISLWQTLEQIPYFPFLIFASITAGLFGAGHYTLGHWKLESTSRGLLAIATLLTPLDFLVVAGLSRGQEQGPAGVAIEAASLLVFSLLVLLAARVLVCGSLPAILGNPEGWLTLAVMGSAASQLLVPRWLDPAQTSGLFLTLAFLPAICQVVSLGAVLLALARRERLEGTTANSLFLFLGQATFAAAVALGFLVYWSEDALNALRNLAMPIALAGMPILIAGALVHRLLEKEPVKTETAAPVQRGLSPGIARLVGTTTTLIGVLIMLGALVLAWPRTDGLIVIGVVNAVAFTVAALRYHLPQAHVPALVCLTVASLTAFHGLIGNLTGTVDDPGTRWLSLAQSPASGSLLAFLTVGLGLTAELGIRYWRRLDALYHIVGSGVAAGLALLLTGLAGGNNPERAALVFGVCGLGCLVVNRRWRLPQLSFAGSMILLGATAFTLRLLSPELAGPRLAMLTLLTEATALLTASLLLARIPHKPTAAEASDTGPISTEETFVVPFRLAGLTATALAVLSLAAAVEWSWLPGCFLCALWLAALWLVVSWVEGWPELFQAFQGVLTVAILLGVSAWLYKQEWLGDHEQPLLEPRSLQAYALGLAVLSLAWAVLRRAVRWGPYSRSMLEPSSRTVDWYVLAALVGGQLFLSAGAVFPEIAHEYLTQLGADISASFGAFKLGQGWILLGILGLTVTVDLWGNRPHESALGWVVLGLTVPLLVSLACREELAVASALRWALSLSFLGYSAILWVRRPLWRWCEALGIGWPTSADVPQWVRSMLLAGTVLPVLLLTGWVAGLGFLGEQPVGPDAGSVFARMGWTAATVVPLLLLTLGLVGHGAREDLAGYISAAGYLLTVTLMGGYALGLVTSGETITGAKTAFLLQLGILGIAGWGLAWLASGRWRDHLLLTCQVSLGLLGCVAVCLVTFPCLLARPAVSLPKELHEFLLQTGNLAGWLGLLCVLALAVWYTRIPGSSWRTIQVLGGCGFLLGIVAGCTAVRWDKDGWLAFHTLSLFWALYALALLACGWAGAESQRVGPIFWSDERRTRTAALLGRLFPVGPTRYWVEGFGLVVVLLALAESLMHPARSYWSCAAPLAVSVLLGADAVWSRRPSLVYGSGLLINVSGYLLWRSWVASEWEGWGEVRSQPGQFTRLLYLQIICLGLASSCWSLLELKLRRLERPIDLRGRWVPFVHAAPLVAVHLLGLVVLTGVAGDLTGAAIHIAEPLGWLALAMTLVATALCFWDAEATLWGLPLAPLYATGLLFLGLVLNGLELSAQELVRAATPLLAGYLTVTATIVWLARRGSGGVGLGRRLRIPPRTDAGLTPWLLPGQALVGVLVLCLSVWLCLAYPTPAERLSGPAAVALLTLTGLILTACWPAVVPAATVPSKDTVPRQITLVLGLLAVLELSWALLGPQAAALWLHRSVLLLFVLSLFTILYRSGLVGRVNRESAWASNARQQGSVLAVLTLVVLGAVLVQEFLLYDPALRRVPLAWPGALLVTALLGAMLVGTLVVAIAQRWNPFALSAEGKVKCVYAAEVFLVLLLIHLRLNVPDLFPGWIGQHWALLLMILGFVGVGLAELFQRRGLPILAGPLQQTGLFLPLLPLVAFLLQPLSQLRALGEVIPGFQPLLRYLDSDRLPSSFQLHALLWFLLGTLYALVAILRRSSLFALLAALAANFGLWVVYANVEGLSFLLHPQLFLIPFGLILLSAEHLNRARLTEAQSQGVRYLGLLLIYVSSTADMFIMGLGNSVLLPVTLAVLSILGVLGGILLRVRAFLLSGVTFLFLVVFAQIWHAAVDRSQTWVWWASGIVLGASILTLFALFEKRRNDVLHFIEDIKGWH